MQIYIWAWQPPQTESAQSSGDLPREAAVADAIVILDDLETGGTSRFNPEESPEETVGPDNSFPWSKGSAGESGDLQCEALGPEFAYGHDSIHLDIFFKHLKWKILIAQIRQSVNETES